MTFQDWEQNQFCVLFCSISSVSWRSFFNFIFLIFVVCRFFELETVQLSHLVNVRESKIDYKAGGGEGGSCLKPNNEQSSQLHGKLCFCQGLKQKAPAYRKLA